MYEQMAHEHTAHEQHLSVTLILKLGWKQKKQNKINTISHQKFMNTLNDRKRNNYHKYKSFFIWNTKYWTMSVKRQRQK